MRSLGAAAGAVVSAVVLAGCYAQTEPASDVGSTSATLNAHGFTTGKQGQAFFQYSSAKNALGTGFGLRTPTLTFPPGLSGPFTARVSGLSPGTNYWFRVCGNDVGDQPFCNSDLEFTTVVPGAKAAFAPPLSTVGGGARAVGDFNGDGDPDLVVSDPTAIRVLILLGNGDATFRETGTIDTVPGAVADFNRDGRQDLLGSDPFNPNVGIEVFPGRGDGTFEAPLTTRSPLGLMCCGVAPGDFNRDGKPDIAVTAASGGRGSISYAFVMLNNGNGTFQQPDQTFVASQPPQQASWSSPVVGDLNRDGKLDMALGKGGCSTTPSLCGVSVFLGNGNGTFGSEQVYAAGTELSELVAGAFHGANSLDLIVRTSTGLTVLNGAGDGTFQVGPSYTTADFPQQAADINGDGKLDLVAYSSSRTAVWLGNGNGTLQSPIPASSCSPTDVIADFNGDAKPDIACSGPNETRAVILNATPPPS